MYDVDDIIDIPTYYNKYVDKTVDLNVTKNIPCKFHGEVSGKSFTYSGDKKVWRCWGACHCGGGVVQLHRLNYRLRSDEEALSSLRKILGLREERNITLNKPKQYEPNNAEVEIQSLIAKCNRKAKTVEQQLELDYIMSQYPVTKEQLELYLEETT